MLDGCCIERHVRPDNADDENVKQLLRPKLLTTSFINLDTLSATSLPFPRGQPDELQVALTRDPGSQCRLQVASPCYVTLTAG